MAVQLSDRRVGPRSESVATDGRVLRGERNREAIVDALLELFDQGELEPDRASRSRNGPGCRCGRVFQHFDDMEGLCAAVAQRQIDRIWSHLEPLPTATSRSTSASTRVVAQRSYLFETIAPTRRAADARARRRHPTLMRGLRALRGVPPPPDHRDRSSRSSSVATATGSPRSTSRRPGKPGTGCAGPRDARWAAPRASCACSCSPCSPPSRAAA